MCWCVCMYVCWCLCMCVCWCVCMCWCVCVCGWMFSPLHDLFSVDRASRRRCLRAGCGISAHAAGDDAPRLVTCHVASRDRAERAARPSQPGRGQGRPQAPQQRTYCAGQDPQTSAEHKASSPKNMPFPGQMYCNCPNTRRNCTQDTPLFLAYKIKKTSLVNNLRPSSHRTQSTLQQAFTNFGTHYPQGSVHTSCKQHQRVCTQICAQICLCVLCECRLTKSHPHTRCTPTFEVISEAKKLHLVCG